MISIINPLMRRWAYRNARKKVLTLRTFVFACLPHPFASREELIYFPIKARHKGDAFKLGEVKMLKLMETRQTVMASFFLTNEKQFPW